jgi:hypothetical protein
MRNDHQRRLVRQFVRKKARHRQLHGSMARIKLSQWPLDPMKFRSNFKQLSHARWCWPTIGLRMRRGHEEHGDKDCVSSEAV